MKAAVFKGKKDLVVQEVNLDENIGEKQVLVNVKACGVCGTDVHIYNGSEGSASVTPPVILGHEFSGIVEKVGSGVTSVKVGDKVSVDPNDMCGECKYCLEGQNQFCENLEATGVTMNGGFAEKVVVKEKQIYKVAEHVAFEDAAMIEPVSCCLHGLDLMEIKAGDTVLVLGGGAIGMIMLQLAKYSGASKIILSDPVESKRKLALELGADIVVDPINEDIREKVLANGVTNVNKVVECVGMKATMKQAVDIAGFGATIMMFGLTAPDEEIGVKPFEIFKKELKITSSFINPYTFGRAVAILETGNINLEKLYSKVKLDDIEKVFTEELYRGGKIVIVNE